MKTEVTPASLATVSSATVIPATAPNTMGRLVRRGFTLIELLVVITIIGILVGFIAPAVFRALTTSEEFVINSDIVQLNASVEAFKTKYGFYPPDFTRIRTLNDFIPYLNRIAPNHGHTPAQLNAWWTNIGSQLSGDPMIPLPDGRKGPVASYVFWLSGLSKNKQYPLTDLSGVPLVAYNQAINTAGTAVPAIEREVFYDFKSDRLLIDGFIAGYSQYRGRPEPFVYFELNSLPSLTNANFTTFLSELRTVGTQKGTSAVYPYFDPTKSAALAFSERLAKRDSFQFIAAGLDGLFAPDTGTTTQDIMALVPANAKFERDNLTNFSNGRLEVLINGN